MPWWLHRESTGYFESGEVEDYEIEIIDSPPGRTKGLFAAVDEAEAPRLLGPRRDGLPRPPR